MDHLYACMYETPEKVVANSPENNIARHRSRNKADTEVVEVKLIDQIIAFSI